ncbi:MAG TPA: DUF1015 family protein [Caproiciproducens sp.]|nr:DUF1015 family protein [Caproiciproducens sp.]
MAILYPLRALRMPEQSEHPEPLDAELFRTWKESGVLKQDTADTFYICEQEYTRFGQARKVKSLLCRVKTEGETEILPVEQEDPAETAGSLSLLRETSCEFSPVPALYADDGGKTMSRVNMLSRGRPRFEFTCGGITCRLWVVNDLLVIRTICEDFQNRRLWVAGAYGQFEAARQSGSGSVFIMLTDAEQDFTILPYHCILGNGADFDGPRFLADCGAYFDVIPRETMSLRVSDEIESNLDALYRQGRKALGLYSGGRSWTLLMLKEHAMDEFLPQSSEICRNLDCSILHRLVLEKLLRAENTVSFTASAETAVEAVQGNAGRCAFLLSPARKKEIFEIAGEGEKLPPKSVGFYPPFPAGFVMSPNNL